jgi:class 3 adenylate cyclase
MKVQSRKQVPLEAAQALARHLRERPEAARAEPEALAREFGLSPQFVRELLESLAVSRERTSHSERILTPMKRAFHALRLMFRSLTRQPLPFIAVTATISIASYLIIEAFLINGPDEGPLRAGSIMLQGNESLFLSFALATLVLHLACYFRHGMVRYPLFGGLICWLISAPTIMTLIWFQYPEMRIQLAPALMAIALAMLFLNAVYAFVGVGAAIWGGAWRLRQRDRERVMLTRQELLQRMFDVQERLKESEGARPPQKEKTYERFSALFNRQPWVFAVLLGLGQGLLEVVLYGGLFTGLMAGRGPLVALVSLTVFSVHFSLLLAIGFFSKATLKAIFSSWLYLAATMPPKLIPLGSFGPEAFWRELAPPSLAFGLGMALVVASVASAGARVEDRAAQDRKLTQNDPAALLAELVRLQWQLSPHTSDVCILVADAARSAEMKEMADPWTVEYSFREYQLFLERIVHAEGGSVISTAGDGAIAEFPSARDAYRAARRIQTEIEQFNRKINRLERAFRLRIGLHEGPVTGSINDVEFSAVIDIAAHIQAAAPVGGIALSKVAAEHLGDEPLAQLAEPVDGQTVYLSMRPTNDA